uniref:EF-hand domain-containing protein n=1 Tax=Kalanchoe fedtschenkoi TaxID=63787 RepID=A0A7N0RAT5_KALFE
MAAAGTTSSFRLRSSPSLNSVRLRRTFDLFDENADGIITVQELTQALTRLGLDSQLSDLQSVVDSHIKPGLNGLQFDDFQSLHRELDEAFFAAEGDDEANMDSDLTEAFKVFDENGDGYISAMELQRVLEKLGFAEGSEIGKVEKMIGSVDRNCDGVVDFFEFKDMMRRALVVPSA